MPKRSVTVPLPNLVPEVSVPPHLAVPLTHLINAGVQGATTLELQAVGCLHPSRSVAKLKMLGALIVADQSDAVDAQGAYRRRIARYVYQGWRQENAIADKDSEDIEDRK
ncbi:hypothetical protein H2508_12695 [Parahaliea sp. F7430]|uniref:Uncharacterized protein n=1 Tax=Sediminihaliea albiluteola TaxID=2758564 RepID=A0A7W2TXW1_9GAMM|nr:hypothetical protein [Sediminihaliea albiluteola]MBA6413971.1 hypothetical protein [Sediminihaliea albiluteola]